MRITYDSEVDTLTIVFVEAPARAKKLGEGLTAGYDAQGRLTALQIDDAAGRMGGLEPLHQIILEGVGLPVH